MRAPDNLSSRFDQLITDAQWWAIVAFWGLLSYSNSNSCNVHLYSANVCVLYAKVRGRSSISESDEERALMSPLSGPSVMRVQ